MPRNIRYPRSQSSPIGRAERGQIITLAQEITELKLGGEATYADITAWRFAKESSPYTHVVIEVTGTAAMVIGDGTAAEAIGLFGQVGDRKALLGVLGYSVGEVMPQIPIVSAEIGCSQIVNYVAVYDRLSVGGIRGTIDILEGHTITVTARPIREQDYGG